jgi:DNA mismatch repair ATPase MutS
MKNEINLMYPSGYKKVRAREMPVDYISNLELAQIAAIISPQHHDYALKILCELNTDSELIRYRQDILQDFTDFHKLESVLQESIRELFYTFKSVGRNYGTTHSFFELNENLKILKSYMRCMDRVHQLYETNYAQFKSEGVKNLMDVFEESYNSKHYRKMREEVIFLTNALETGFKSITVGINLDEEMRPVQTVLLEVNREPFREKGKFDSLLYKNIPENTAANTMTSMYDKNGALDYSNKRIFDELNKIACDYRKHINTALLSFTKSNAEYIIDLAPQIEFYSGAKKLKELMENRGMSMCRPEITPQNERVTILLGMYDLAFANKYIKRKDREPIVTNSCKMDDDSENARIMILTGPNNGGKTTYARAIGICHVLAQAGLFVPAESARISPVDYIFTHFPKEEEVGVNTSRFTEECKDLKNTVNLATEHSLLLLNESISSTTPSECLYVAEEIVKIFCDMGVRGVYVTHMLDLAYKADKINAEINGKSRLVSVTVGRGQNNERDYKVVKGLPLKSSYALDIFDKYGVSYDEYKKKRK